MNGLRTNLIRIGAGVLALALLIVMASPADAAGIAFTNNTKSRILVQTSSYVNKMLRKGPVLVIDPGKTGSDTKVPPGPCTIIIQDALTNQIVFRGTIPNVNATDLLYYSVEVANHRVQLRKLP